MPQELLSQVVVGDAANGDGVARQLIVIISGGASGPLEIWLTKLLDASVASELFIRFIVLQGDLVATQAILDRLPSTFNASAIALPTATDFASALCNMAIEHAGADFAFIAAGASIPFAWDARLRKAVYASARNAIASSDATVRVTCACRR